MNVKTSTERRTDALEHAYTLMEVLVAVAVIGVVFVTLYLGMLHGFAIVKLGRENLRATQILEEKMEIIRLYTWPQINTAGFIPQSFTNYFYPVGTQNTLGTAYVGSMTLGPSGFTEAYSNDLQLVTVTVTWQSGNVQRTRTMYSYVSQYGLHDYIY